MESLYTECSICNYNSLITYPVRHKAFGYSAEVCPGCFDNIDKSGEFKTVTCNCCGVSFIFSEETEYGLCDDCFDKCDAEDLETLKSFYGEEN